jgi:hypothetical protein
MKKYCMLIWLACLSMTLLQAQTSLSDAGDLKVGLRLQKAQKLYWENGVDLDYSASDLLHRKLHLSAAFVSSRLGSALGSNAVKQDNYLVGAAWHFRPESALQPFVRLNLGYFYADYESTVFDALTNAAFFTALDAGLSYRFRFPMELQLSAGYNLQAGTGVAGPGTLFPFYYQLSLLYTLF